MTLEGMGERVSCYWATVVGVKSWYRYVMLCNRHRTLYLRQVLHLNCWISKIISILKSPYLLK